MDLAVRHKGGGLEYHPSSLGYTPLAVGMPLRSVVVSFAIGFHPLKAAGAITFVFVNGSEFGLREAVSLVASSWRAFNSRH